MIAMEFRDEEFDAIIKEAREVIKTADKAKKAACKLIKKLALIEDEDMEEDNEYPEEEMEEVMYKAMPVYRSGGNRSSNRTVYRRMRMQ